MKHTIMVVVAVVALAAGCGSGSTPASGTLEVAGPNPSASAKMICAKEAQEDIAATVGEDAASVSTPIWDATGHVYSCYYNYGAHVAIVMSVKELSSVKETTSYFDSLGTRLGKTKSFEIAQGSFATTNGSVVVRKDYKVLLIDVSELPAQFGIPPTTRQGVAINIAAVIMACWSGT